MEQSNPIEQRIRRLAATWEKEKYAKECKVLRLLATTEEDFDMVKVFYQYMIGVNTPVYDIAFHFETVCENVREYSQYLLDELREIIESWNMAEKETEEDPIEWQVDLSVASKENPAALFVHNFNQLARALDLDDEYFTVAIFTPEFFTPEFVQWLDLAIKAGISDRVRWIIADTAEDTFFDKISSKYSPTIRNLPVYFNMPAAMEQIAAMGSPDNPATAYRVWLMRLVNAMKSRKETDADKAGKKCIQIANDSIAKDAYWCSQEVAVLLMLGNDKMSYRKYDAALQYADEAIRSINEKGRVYLDEKVCNSLLALSSMFRGTLLYLQKKSEASFTDYKTAGNLYEEEGNMPLAIEAYRMAGKAGLRAGMKKEAINVLAHAALLGRQIDAPTAHATTYPGVLQLLLEESYERAVSYETLNGIASHLFGENWSTIIKKWGKIPDTVASAEEMEKLFAEHTESTT